MMMLLVVPAVVCPAPDAPDPAQVVKAEARKLLSRSPLVFGTPGDQKRALKVLAVQMERARANAHISLGDRRMMEEVIPNRDAVLRRCRADGALRDAVRKVLKEKAGRLLRETGTGASSNDVDNVVRRLMAG